MSRVSPYHTNSTDYPPEHRHVHHDYDDCPDGKRIKPEHRASGTGNKPRCKECIVSAPSSRLFTRFPKGTATAQDSTAHAFRKD
jgi:hypothetical protein